MYSKFIGHISDLSKQDVHFIIQKKTCEMPDLFVPFFHTNIVLFVENLKKEFDIEEKMEFSKDQVVNQLMMLDSTSHQTSFTVADSTEETKANKER